MGLEAGPSDQVLVLATLANLAHLVVVNLPLKYGERWLRLSTLGLDPHIVCHRLYRHLLNPLGDLPSELSLPPIFIYVSGMHRVHYLKLGKHVYWTNPGVRQHAQLVPAKKLIELVISLLKGFLLICGDHMRVADGLIYCFELPTLSPHANHGFPRLRAVC